MCNLINLWINANMRYALTCVCDMCLSSLLRHVVATAVAAAAPAN